MILITHNKYGAKIRKLAYIINFCQTFLEYYISCTVLDVHALFEMAQLHSADSQRTFKMQNQNQMSKRSKNV